MRKALLLLTFFWAAALQLSAQVVNISGDISSNQTWTADKTYLLSGFVYVTNGAKLTIEPGTVIKGDKATKGSLIVARGAQIIANGTANQPIVFTSNEASPTYGDWGGLIILGYAPTNQSYNGTPGLGLVEGGIDPVKGLYGGGDQPGGAKSNDNSGILRFVRVEYAGIAFQPNNEINGITFGGVGNGTTVECVQVSYANDDSFEWFGGTVNCKYLIAYRGLDDDFDCDFGYSGKVQFALAVRDPGVADVSGSNGFEVDNNGSGSDLTPKTAPTFSNVTIVGPSGANISPDFKRANHLRRNCEIGIFNSVFVGAYPVGLLIDGASTVANAQSGKFVVKNSFYHGMATPLSTTESGFDIAAYATANGISTGPNATDAGLVNPFNLGLPNPRPNATSPVLGYAKFNDARIQDPFFIPVSYAGAFGPSGDWTCPWASWENAGCLPANSEVIVSGDITSNTTWTADKTYLLNGFVYVTNGAKLTIEPGTVIKGDKATKGSLIVTRGSQIIADGKLGLPIVFTSNEADPTYGDWGGLIILGYAPTNQTYNGTPGLGLIEGGIDPVKGLYGGGDQTGGATPNDNSGILRYVRVEYAGIAFQPNNEINGITFGGVGSGTTVDYVQVSYANDDSFEWFGGTVNCKHLIAYRGLDDDFDCDFGFAGNIQYALAVRDPQVADVSGSNGFVVDNNGTGSDLTPKTAPTFSNVTLLGPTAGQAADFKRAAHLRRNCEIGIFNSLLMGSYPVGLLIDGASTVANAQAGKLEVKNTWVAGETTLLSTTEAGFDIAAWFNTAGWNNNSAAATSAVALQNPYYLDKPNAQPAYNSPALGAAAFTAARINTAFFDKVSYVGAFDGSSDWTCGWGQFVEKNSDCLTETETADKYINEVKLFPTVASDQVTLQFSLTQNTSVNVEIYGLDGQYFGQQLNVNAFAGEQTVKLDVSQIPAGFFFVRIQAGAAVKTAKLIVVR
ncbi:MAG: T9SS type A sorting domain-containing protein [Lewinellaceae bacterium]|nr:T9SS type A sorting domain-containing protein [Lewinellaceae bacterium]